MGSVNKKTQNQARHTSFHPYTFVPNTRNAKKTKGKRNPSLSHPICSVFLHPLTLTGVVAVP